MSARALRSRFSIAVDMVLVTVVGSLIFVVALAIIAG